MSDPDDVWQMISEGMYMPYCGSDTATLMFSSQNQEKMAVTKDLNITEGDVIQFRVREYT